MVQHDYPALEMWIARMSKRCAIPCTSVSSVYKFHRLLETRLEDFRTARRIPFDPPLTWPALSPHPPGFTLDTRLTRESRSIAVWVEVSS